jgi:hypothetical protein
MRRSGEITIFEDDHYYMAPLIAVLLARAGASVTYVTTTGSAGEWSHYVYRELVGEEPAGPAQNIQRIGDCRQPALIAHAVYSGHKAARELDEAHEAPRASRDRSVVPGG